MTKKLIVIGHSYILRFNRGKIRELAKYYRVLLIVPDHIEQAASNPLDEIDLVSQEGYSVVVLKARPLQRQCTMQLYIGLGSVISAFKPDIIHVENEPWSLLRWQARVLTALRTEKCIFSEFTWENTYRRGLRGRIFNLAYRAAAVTSELVVCGNTMARKFMTSSGVSPNNIHVDGNIGLESVECISADKAERMAWRDANGYSARDFIIGYCGRMAAQKGIFELIESVSEIHKENPQVKLALLGDGPLNESISQYEGTQDWLRLYPRVSQEDVNKFINKLDLFVLASKPIHHGKTDWEEQFGHVLIEAMAAGVLTIGSNSGGIPDVIGNERLIFTHGSAETLRSKIHDIISNRPSYQELVDEKQAHCRSYWNNKSMAYRYHSFWEKHHEHKQQDCQIVT